MDHAEAQGLIFSGPMMAVSNSLTCCPFCGLLCDDLNIRRDGEFVRLSPHCSRASRLFEVPNQGQAMVDGQSVSLDRAYQSAAAILTRAYRPLVGGLACDVSGHRAALRLAENTGGVVDHMNGGAQFRNWLAFQDGGWITTTLSEVRNRADLIVFAGTVASDFPRFFERCLSPESQFGELRRRVVILGGGADSAVLAVADLPVVSIPVQENHLGALFAALRARNNGHRQDASTIAGVPSAQIDSLLADMRAARYGVLVWHAAELDFPHADLTIQAMVDLVKDLNLATRWSGLPLSGNDGDTSAAQVCTWQAGYPLRTAFEAGGPHYEPLLFGTERLLNTCEVDAVMWISAFDPERTPPEANCPTVVLGRADMTFSQAPDVFIPVAVPGVQHAGFLHRMDAVVALPLHAPLPSGLPSVAQAIAAIQKEMNHAAA